MDIDKIYKLKNMAVDVTLAEISGLSGFFPVLAALYNYRHFDNVLKIAAFFFFIASLFDPIMWLLMNYNGTQNTMPMIHLNILVSLFFLSIIYYQAFFKSILKKGTIVLSVITFTIIVNYSRHIYIYPSVSNTTLSIEMIILSLIYFYQLLNPVKFIDIEKQGLFWINAGVLFYFSVNIFLFMVLTHIPLKDQRNYYIINSIVNIIANILFSVGLFCKPQKTT